MGYVTPSDGRRSEARAWRHLLHFVHDHPRRNPLYCELLTRVAPKIGTGHAQGRWDWNADFVLKFAFLLDRPGNHCLDNVRAAVPNTPDAQAALAGFTRPCDKPFAQCQADLVREFRESDQQLRDQARRDDRTSRGSPR